jgi:hypothetical protein
MYSYRHFCIFIKQRREEKVKKCVDYTLFIALNGNLKGVLEIFPCTQSNKILETPPLCLVDQDVYIHNQQILNYQYFALYREKNHDIIKNAIVVLRAKEEQSLLLLVSIPSTYSS